VEDEQRSAATLVMPKEHQLQRIEKNGFVSLAKLGKPGWRPFHNRPQEQQPCVRGTGCVTLRAISQVTNRGFLEYFFIDKIIQLCLRNELPSPIYFLNGTNVP
jgi:hypothetical protein